MVFWLESPLRKVMRPGHKWYDNIEMDIER
jgi:hypothetical protein